MELVFGDIESIKLRDNFEKEAILKKLNNTVVCPLCGAKNIGHFDFLVKEKLIGWNFDCEDDCPNSFESSFENQGGSEDTRLYTNFRGKFVNY